ncbi:hypothetical protein DY000_02049700 [Brassica cretica]|uniref:Uncharacterized protein n=1 Tax=Brassica cretica TaxID=69181 RepID=A0ABQ7F2E1_BRACR|nr:hypothetical protein DY000_02049700 [Brassica cretica]
MPFLLTDSLSIEAIASEDPFTSELSSQRSTNTQNERSNARVGSREDNSLSAFGAFGPSSAASRMWGNQEEQRRMHVQYTPSSYQVQATSPQQMTYPRMGGSGTHNMMQNLPRIATGEVHSSFQSPHGLTSPPMYTSTAAVTLLSLALSLSMSGYPSHEATVPMPYDISSPSSGYNNSFSRGFFSPTAQNAPLVDPFQVQYY